MIYYESMSLSEPTWGSDTERRYEMMREATGTLEGDTQGILYHKSGQRPQDAGGEVTDEIQ